ncbi:MAG: sensor domain-containing diguanylate cyclase [Gemmatimonadaceae bacterium]|nr:sensor domain-containing diguanylate cyclase [Gemmatimonadaceae bacterium]
MRDRSIPRTWQHAALVGWWSLALVLVAVARGHLFAPLSLAARVACQVAGVLVALGGVTLLVRCTVREATRRRVGTVAAAMAPVCALFAIDTDGVRSVAFVLAAVCVLGTIVALGARATWIGTAALVLVSTLGLALRGDAVPMADIAYALAIVGAVTVLPAVSMLRSAERETVRMLEELPSFGVTATSAGGDAVTGGVRERDGHDLRMEADALGRYLRQVRDTLGASDAVFWRAPVPGGALAPQARATGEARRLRDDVRLGRDLAPVLQASRVALLDRGAQGMLAAVAVPGAAGSIGVLSLHEPRAAMGSELLSRWLPRFSDNLGLLVQLLETQAEYSRQTRQSAAVLDASQQFQKHRDEEALRQVVVDSALRVTGGARAALVRWTEETDSGVVTNVTAGHHLVRGVGIGRDSLVAQLCRAGLPQVWEDARRVEETAPVYAALRPVVDVESLAVIPLRQANRTTGAIVVEGHGVGDVLVREVRNLRLLATIAAESLETVRHIEQAQRRANTDALTGLLNRGAFDDALRREIAEADRYGRPVGLIVCDVDHFKRVNDLFGHDAGDEVLKAVATSLTAGVRDIDLVARYGGEELVVLLVQSDLAHTWEVADRLRAAIEGRTIPVGDQLLRVTASFGVAAYPETAHLGDELFPAADRALYEAKREGRNCVRFARPLSLPLEGAEGDERPDYLPPTDPPTF